ncbi:starfish, testis, sperm, Peptide Transposon [Apostichopus japonicus]|uniref:Starfish, testis, sperm, Peptide Transposon n=1 Tax=Stichopus japonicus TaxID=307972 RepID=A0A2G8KW66_STIJA|nr:starfish, testis, sperm, Peptide Transposon [Apostichopus japonicus]
MPESRQIQNRAPEVVYFGHIFSAQGISPEPAKINDIKTTEVPIDTSAVRSFLWLTQYVSRFIPNYASITAPLRELTKKDFKFEWSDECNQAFEQLKRT